MFFEDPSVNTFPFEYLISGWDSSLVKSGDGGTGEII